MLQILEKKALLTLVICPQLPKSTLMKSTAVMKVFDFNRFSKHEIIGEIRVQLCNVDWNHIIEEWQELEAPAKFEVCFPTFPYSSLSGGIREGFNQFLSNDFLYVFSLRIQFPNPNLLCHSKRKSSYVASWELLD